jgi:hypothetical protein
MKRIQTSTDGSTPSASQKNQKLSPSSIVGEIENQQHIEIIFDDGDILTIQIDAETAKAWHGKISESDPAIAFNWSSSLEAGLQTINNQQPLIPAWFPAGTVYPLSIIQLKLAILQFCMTGVTRGTITDLFVIAPNDTTESMHVAMRINSLVSDPFIIELANAVHEPLARIHLFMDKSTRTTSVLLNAPRSPTLAAHDIQAFV